MIIEYFFSSIVKAVIDSVIIENLAGINKYIHIACNFFDILDEYNKIKSINNSTELMTYGIEVLSGDLGKELYEQLLEDKCTNIYIDRTPSGVYIVNNYTKPIPSNNLKFLELEKMIFTNMEKPNLNKLNFPKME
jgi:hypothetical protein